MERQHRGGLVELLSIASRRGRRSLASSSALRQVEILVRLVRLRIGDALLIVQSAAGSGAVLAALLGEAVQDLLLDLLDELLCPEDRLFVDVLVAWRSGASLPSRLRRLAELRGLGLLLRQE